MSIISVPRSYIVNKDLEDDLFIFVLRLKAEFENGTFSLYDIPKLQTKLQYNQPTLLKLIDKAFDYHFLTKIQLVDDYSMIDDYKSVIIDYLKPFIISYNLSNKNDVLFLEDFLLKYNSITFNISNYKEFLQDSFCIAKIILKRHTRANLYINTLDKLAQKSFSLETSYKSLEIILQSVSNIMLYLKSDIVLKRRISFSEQYIKKQFNILLSTFDNLSVDNFGEYRSKNIERKNIKNINRHKTFRVSNKKFYDKLSKFSNLKDMLGFDGSTVIKINSFRPNINQLKNRIPTSEHSNESINQYEWLQLPNYSTAKDLLITPEISYKLDLEFVKSNPYHLIKRKIAEIRILYAIQYENKSISYTELSSYCKLSRSKTVDLINEMVKSKLVFKNHFDSVLIEENVKPFKPKGNYFIYNNNLYQKPKNEYDILSHHHVSWQIGKKEKKKHKNNKLLNISLKGNPFKELKDKLQKLQNFGNRIEHFKVRFNNRTCYIYVNFKDTHFEVYKSTKNTYYRNFINGTHVEDYMLYKFLGKNSVTIMYSTKDCESVRSDNSQEVFTSKFFNKKSDTNFLYNNNIGFELLFNR